MDHPRSRGVYPNRRISGFGAVGSSPLARGLLQVRPDLMVELGIIPARAGFTLQGQEPSPGRAGSSPLARGLLLVVVADCVGGGIIPARAGFTRSGPGPAAPARDHPRSRGVYSRAARVRMVGGGSSPLARGLRRRPQQDGRRRGIIPARAGFTRVADGHRPADGDHPRSRGVYLIVFAARSPKPGSSPLARGLPTSRPGIRALARIIPARAGFTRSPLEQTGARGDHPRSRGVYPTTVTRTLTRQGSSPLARGLRIRDGARTGTTVGSSPLARGLHLRIVGIPTNP